MTLLDLNLLQPLATVLILVGLGMVCRVAGLISDAGQRDISALVLKVFVSIMLFMAGLQGDPGVLARQGPLVAVAGLAFPYMGFGLGALTARLFRLPARQASVVRVSASLCNTAFVGIPVCTALWGAEGALLAAIYDQFLNIPLLTVPPLEYGQGRGQPAWRSLLLAPMMWGLVLGVGWNLLGLGIPTWVEAPLTLVSSATLPLSLILVGSLAIPSQMGAGMLRPLAAFLSSRLVIVPLAALAVVTLLGARGIGAGVAVLQAAMPASVMATVMAKEYQADANLASAGALLSIVLSVITLPVMATLVLILRN